MATDTRPEPRVTRQGKLWRLVGTCRHTGMCVVTEYRTEGAAQRMCDHLRGVRYVHHGLSVTPLWSTRRLVAGGSVVDIEIRDPRSTINGATVAVDSIEELPTGR